MRTAAGLALVLALAGCTAWTVAPSSSEAQPVAGVDPLSQQLLSEHGLRPSGPSSVARSEVWQSADEGVPWDLYLEASQRIGLDFRKRRGAPAELRTTPLRGPAGARAHVLVLNGAVIGAWLSEPLSAPGIYSLDEPPRGPDS